MQIRPFILAVAVAAAGLTTFTAISPAMASEGGVLVQYEDLNLGSPAGRAALDNRIDRAARMVCGTSLINELNFAAAVESCRASTIAAARHQLAAASQADRYAALRVVRNAE